MITNIVAMWDHAGMVHVGEQAQPCPSMRDGGAGISFAEFFYLCMHRPQQICKDCIAMNRQAHDDFVAILSASRGA